MLARICVELQTKCGRQLLELLRLLKCNRSVFKNLNELKTVYEKKERERLQHSSISTVLKSWILQSWMLIGPATEHAFG